MSTFATLPPDERSLFFRRYTYHRYANETGYPAGIFGTLGCHKVARNGAFFFTSSRFCAWYFLF
jgi:hypothetical protein